MTSIIKNWLAKIFVQKADSLAESDSLLDAIDYYNKAIKYNPEVAGWYIRLGRLLFKKGDTSGSIAEYKKALALDDQQPVWWFQLSKVLWSEERRNEAVEAVGMALEIDATKPAWYAQLGQYLTKLGRRIEAADAYRKAVGLKDDQPTWKAELAFLDGQNVFDITENSRPKEWYDEVYMDSKEYREDYKASIYFPVWKRIIDMIIDANSHSVLEIGCGSGQLARAVFDKIRNIEYLGFDFSEQATILAKKLCPEAKFETADIFNTNLLKDHQYDLVLCTEVLEHIDFDLEVIQKVRKGTMLIATVPDFDSHSHVRFFENTAEVYTRYAQFFNNMQIEPISLNDEAMLFLFSGERK